MILFRKRVAHIETNHDSRVEVVVHKNATREAVQSANEANKHLASLLEQNGFTLKIWVAAGGKHKGKTK
jgi:hypothetical protein